MFYILFLLFFCGQAIAIDSANTIIQESLTDAPQVVSVVEIVQPIIDTTTDSDIDFDDLTDQMEESGIDFTVEQPSRIQLLLRKIGMYFVPFIPFYISASKWTKQNIAWVNKKQHDYSMSLYTFLATLTDE